MRPVGQRLAHGGPWKPLQLPRGAAAGGAAQGGPSGLRSGERRAGGQRRRRQGKDDVEWPRPGKREGEREGDFQQELTVSRPDALLCFLGEIKEEVSYRSSGQGFGQRVLEREGLKYTWHTTGKLTGVAGWL